MTDPVADLTGAVAAAASGLRGDGAVDLPRLSRPPRADFGDYSTNAALLLAPSLGEQPRAIAERLGDSLGTRLGPAVERLEVAGPGFLNLFMADAWYLDAVAGLLDAGERYGAGSLDESVNVEFVSANPTGPVTVAAGRHAAYGDALCRILEYAGARVEREYYVNDSGTQITRFGESIRARARGEEPPEDGYRGAYVRELAERIPGAAHANPDELARAGVDLVLEGARATLARFRVRMDRFFSERSLRDTQAIKHTLDLLEEHEHVYPLDGAVWLRTTTFGDDKDRVLLRSNGELTYFASDIAYHEDKRERGYDRVIDVLGADHHGYKGRMRAAWQALGGDPGGYEIVIMQLVNLTEGGRRAQMSKRQGEFVTLDDLIDDIGVDAARWFLLQRSHDTTLDLDLDLARRESQDNPVYYVQYAHARIASILRKAGEGRVSEALGADLLTSSERFHPSARALVKRLLELPEELREATTRRAPHRLTAYTHETAQDFSAFYRDCRVLGAAEEGGDEDVRLALCVLTQRVIARGLDLLGVEAPDRM
jgi:arginyl-tRNA synthetase